MVLLIFCWQTEKCTHTNSHTVSIEMFWAASQKPVQTHEMFTVTPLNFLNCLVAFFTSCFVPVCKYLLHSICHWSAQQIQLLSLSSFHFYIKLCCPLPESKQPIRSEVRCGLLLHNMTLLTAGCDCTRVCVHRMKFETILG